MGIPLSVVVPSRKPWPHPEPAVDALLDQVAAVGGEVILAVGHPNGAPADVPHPMRVVTVPDNDVFAARANAVVAVRGEIVAILEDHCFAPDGWAKELLASWERKPAADALITTIRNGAAKRLDEASFLLTWAPFIGPLQSVPTDRTPAPGIVSYRRRVLPATVPPPGWLEYELPVLLRDAGRMVADDTIWMTHTQHLGWRAFLLQYWAGRGFTGGTDHPAARQPRRARLRYAYGMPRRLVGQTRGALMAHEGHGDLVTLGVVGAMALCNTAGQFAGILRGTPGRSLRELE